MGTFKKLYMLLKFPLNHFFSKLKKVIETKAFTSNCQRYNSENVLMLGTENGGYIFVLIQRDETHLLCITLVMNIISLHFNLLDFSKTESCKISESQRFIWLLSFKLLQSSKNNLVPWRQCMKFMGYEWLKISANYQLETILNLMLHSNSIMGDVPTTKD